MSGVEKIPLRIPSKWDPEWFAAFVRDVLSKMDTRNATGVGVSISSDGNSVATIDVTATIDDAIDAHDAEAAAHATQIALAVTTHDADPDAHEEQIEAALDVHRLETDPHPEMIEDLPLASSVELTDYVPVAQIGAQRKAGVIQMRAVLLEGWTDMRFPASQIDPVGLIGAASRITSLTGYTGALEFSGSADNVCAGICQLDHGWAPGTALKPHIHWTNPTGQAGVDWRFYYRIVGNPRDVAGAWSSAQSPVVTIGDPSVNDEHCITTFPDIEMTGYIESAIVYWQLHRLGNSDSASGEAVLHELDFHVLMEKVGTAEPIPSVTIHPFPGRIRVVGQ